LGVRCAGVAHSRSAFLGLLRVSRSAGATPGVLLTAVCGARARAITLHATTSRWNMGLLRGFRVGVADGPIFDERWREEAALVLLDLVVDEAHVVLVAPLDDERVQAKRGHDELLPLDQPRRAFGVWGGGVCNGTWGGCREVQVP